MSKKPPPDPNHPVRLFLVDDHAVVRQGTREMLNRDPRFEVVGESGSGEELSGMLRLKSPDVLLLDINLPGQNGLQLLEMLKPEFPQLKIILFSAHGELQYIRRAQALKADGFLTKTVSEADLCQAILAVMESPATPVYSTDVAEKLQEHEQLDKQQRLTARELEILQQLAQGHTNQTIAKNLCLSVKTVDTHVANLMKKTGVNKRTQLLAYAYEHNLL